MKSHKKKIWIIIGTVFGGFFLYGLYHVVGFFFWLESVGPCGFDDGPFEAMIIKEAIVSDSAIVFDISNNGQLLVENRADSISPILVLRESNEMKWIIDLDVSKTEGYESTRIWKISNVNVINDSDPIELGFLGHWTYGIEYGSIEIDRSTGRNSFCLSW